MKFKKNQKVKVFDNTGIIVSTDEAPEKFGVKFDATENTYSVTACHIAPLDITDEIKTFEDAIAKLGENNSLVKQYRAANKNAQLDEYDDAEDVMAFLELRIITAALNDGWKPQFTEDEWRYFPWFYLYTKDEYERLDEDEKARCRVVGRAGYSSSANAGLVYACANNASSYSGTSFGSRLAFKTRELALYAGKQFFDYWFDFYFG